MQKQVFWVLFVAVALCFSAKAQEFSYQTFSFSQDNIKALSTENKAISPLLYVAKSKEGILYAGNRNLGRCVPLLKNNQQEAIPLKDGTLQCENLALKVADSKIVGAITATKNFQLNLKLLDSMVLKQQEVIYQYPAKSKQSKDASIATKFYCAKDSNTQKILQSLYGESFDCKNAKKVFLKKARDSMQEYFEEILQANNQESAIEEYLQTAPFEEINGISLYYFDKDLLVFLQSNYLYTGGAHGISSEWGVIVSKEKGLIPLNTKINLENEELKNLLWQEYQNYLQNIKAKSFVDFQSFKVSEAVLIDYDSFVFIYQPYEIMPYAYGIIELRIPFKQIEKMEDFDKTPFKSLFIP